MIRTARTIFGIYALIIFMTTLIISTLCYFLIFTFASEKKAPFIAHQVISRPWARLLFILFGIRVIVKNKNLLDPKQTYVFIANHRSLLDIPAYAVATNHTIRFLAKVELTKIPLMGYIIRRLYVSVDRKDKAARARSMDNMMNALRDGISVFICPEGTRNKGGEPLLPFHDGAFRLAIQSQLPLGVLVITNSEQLLSPLHSIGLAPGRLFCIWTKPISTIGMTQDDLPSLKERAIKQMLEHL
jgi:1-acyl-sn-glycerol-3-phosphate acyltransferase